MFQGVAMKSFVTDNWVYSKAVGEEMMIEFHLMTRLVLLNVHANIVFDR